LKDSTICFEVSLILQKEDRGSSFNLNSSRENKRITKAIGVNNPKNIIPSIIGLIIEPRIKPKRIHNLFSGNNRPGFIIVSIKKIVANNKKAIAILTALTK
tara:strand:+ start:700 stop:1002 length:303 start_codon:yes stop_codon:yes gene_type:complete